MTDSVLIIGGGVAGLTAAITCSNAGVRAIVVEHNAIVGGKLAATLGDRSGSDEQIITPDLDDISARTDKTRAQNQTQTRAEPETQDIEILTLSYIEGVEGSAGDFTINIRERARFVTDACTRCNNCPQVCPQVVANDFDAGLTFRKAIDTPLMQTLPAEFVIDIDSCLNTPPNYLPCQRCVEVCDDNAIDFDMALEHLHKRQVAAIIVAAGFEVTVEPHLREFGYGRYSDVVTAMELQRLLQSPGPTGGFAAKPSNEEYPDRILVILHHNSPYAADIMSHQIRHLVDQDIDEITLLILDQKGPDAQLDTLEEIASGSGVALCRGVWVGIKEADDNALCVSYVDLETGQAMQSDFDLVVLSSDVQPPERLDALATMLGVDLADSGYIDISSLTATATSCDGIYAAGCATGPKGIEESVQQARTAAMAALGNCSSHQTALGNKPGQKKHPGWQELSDSEQRLRIEKLLESLIELGEK